MAAVSIAYTAPPPSRFMGTSRPGGSREPWRQATGFGVGFCVVAVILAVANYVLTDAWNGRGGLDPQLTCTAPPLGCWDGLSKRVGELGTTNDTPTRTRAESPVVPVGSKSFYKSVYWNSDANTLAMALLLLVWGIATARAFEHAVLAWMGGSLRLAAFAAILLSIPSNWYAVNAPIHYLNDRFSAFWMSQVAFSVTEAASFAVTMLHVSREAPVSPGLAAAQGGIATAHIMQLLYDERWVIFGGNVGRNLHLLACDVGALVCAASLLREVGMPRAAIMQRCLGVAVALLLVFHLFFSDKASMGLWG
jgi:hypothetical protein